MDQGLDDDGALVRRGLPSHAVDLAPVTTLRLGGPARQLRRGRDERGARRAVRGADDRGEPVAAARRRQQRRRRRRRCRRRPSSSSSRAASRSTTRGDHVVVRAAAGEPWDDLVARCVADGLVGVECLAGIPGSTGATPIQNVGAYGQEVADTVVAVRVLDRPDGRGRGARARGLRLRLPHERVQARPRAAGWCSTSPCVSSASRERADPLRRARPRLGVEVGRPRAARRRARGGARAAPRQGDGARPRRPRHVVGRLVLHEPVRRRRATLARRRAARSRSPTAR